MKRERKIAQLEAKGESPKRVAYLMKLWDQAERRMACAPKSSQSH